MRHIKLGYIMAGIKIESNQMRRSHRIDIPIQVIVENKVYTCKNWSLTGIGIDKLGKEYEFDEVINASLLLKFSEARLEIPVTLRYKNNRNEVSGFEFVDLSESNRRVLREYLELSIEGKLENADGVIGIYNEPILDTPLKESVALSDDEMGVLETAFRKRSRLYLTLGFSLILFIIITVFYNVQYVYRSIGVVSGNFVKVSPNATGKISAIYVNVGDTVEPNTLLFELDERSTVDKIEILDEKLLNLAENRTERRDNSTLLNILYSEKRDAKKRYDKIKSLYQNRLITLSELNKEKELFQRTNIRYLQEKNRSYTNTNQSIIALKTNLELRRSELINNLNYLRVIASTHGLIYAIKSNVGNHVGSGDEVMVIQTNDQPYIVCKVFKSESINIQNNMAAEVYIPSLDKTFKAHVETLGNLSINTESMISNEISLNEVTVKLLLDEHVDTLNLNERVKVWFHKPLW
jgi:multidrug resistance efflux pump